METIYYITNFLGILAGIACVAMISVAVFKIMTGDETEYKKYQTRIKNGLIALILIVCISTVKDTILQYFPYVQSPDAIGDFSDIQISLTDGALTDTYEDVEGRSVIRVKKGKKAKLLEWGDEGYYEHWIDCPWCEEEIDAEFLYCVPGDFKQAWAVCHGDDGTADRGGHKPEHP